MKKDGTLGLVEGERGDSIPAGLSNVVAIATGISLRLALRSDGSVFAWGWYPFSPPGIPASATNITAISAGGRALALRKDGTVIEWALNGVEQTNVPPDLTNVVAISAGSTHSMALKSNGTVVAWGDNSFGQTNVPPGLTNVFAISAGNSRSLALVRMPMPPKLALPNSPPSEGCTLLQITSDPGAAIRIEASADLQTWSILTNFVNASGTNQLRDFSVSGSEHKFYRALLP